VLASGQGKKPVNPDRKLPRRWVPFDVDTAAPDKQEGWGGMSGAGVILPAGDGRLLGLVVAAEADHQERRLYVVPLATALDQDRALSEAVAGLAGAVRVEARTAPRFRDALKPECLGSDGLPCAIGDIDDVGAFGAKPADLPGESQYLTYVPRDGDGELQDSLAEAMEEGKMLLLVGSSAAGKSRSAAE